MPTYQADAVVLRRLDYGEADRILTLLTREHGKLSAIAKSSRRAKARSANGLDLFARSRMMLPRDTTWMSLRRPRAAATCATSAGTCTARRMPAWWRTVDELHRQGGRIQFPGVQLRESLTTTPSRPDCRDATDNR